MTLSANGNRVLLARDLEHLNMDLDGIERVATNAFGLTDTVTFDNLWGTDVTEADTEADVALTGTPGSKTGDATADRDRERNRRRRHRGHHRWRSLARSDSGSVPCARSSFGVLSPPARLVALLSCPAGLGGERGADFGWFDEYGPYLL